MLATAACALAALAGGYYAWRAHTDLALAEQQLARATAAPVEAAPPASATLPEPAAASQAVAPPPPVAKAAEPAVAASRQALPYGYGELPLAAQRLDALRALVGDLTRRGAAGTVHVTSYAADFCLTGNPVEGYVPAPEDMPANRCDVVGNPFDDGLRGAQRESRAFADYLSTLAGPTAGPITVATHHLAHAKALAPFPAAAEALAAAWNQAALANQVVELRFEPRAAAPAP
jgi:hypothetical protein